MTPCNGSPTINREKFILKSMKDFKFKPCKKEASVNSSNLDFCDSCYKKYYNQLAFCLEILAI